jgi:hypothetical protein
LGRGLQIAACTSEVNEYVKTRVLHTHEVMPDNLYLSMMVEEVK